MPTLEHLTRTTPDGIPPGNESKKRDVDLFLSYFEHRINATLDAARQLTMTDNSDSLRGQIQYWRNQLSTIKWLRAMNSQRRKHARTSPAR